MKTKGFFSFYGVYLQIVLAIVAIVVTISSGDAITQNWLLSTVIALMVLVAPLLILIVADLRRTFAKWLRIVIFSVFKVQTFARFGLIVLIAFSSLFLFNLLVFNSYQGEQIFLNVLFINLLLVFFLALVITGKFKVAQPPALLIRNSGKPGVFLYQNGVIRHIPDRATFHLLGYSFEDVADVSGEEFAAYTQRAPLDSVYEARIIQTKVSRETWIIFGDVRKRIPDDATLEFIQSLNHREIEVVSKESLNVWVETESLASVLYFK